MLIFKLVKCRKNIKRTEATQRIKIVSWLLSSSNTYINHKEEEDERKCYTMPKCCSNVNQSSKLQNEIPKLRGVNFPY